MTANEASVDRRFWPGQGGSRQPSVVGERTLVGIWQGQTGTKLLEGGQTIVAGRWNRHSSEYPQTQTLWRTRNKYDSREVRLDDLNAAQADITSLLLGQLEAAGVDLVGDGGLRWDSIYDVTRGIAGCSGFDQLTRIPGANQFHRQPVAELPLSRERSILLNDLRFATRHTSKPLVMSLPGPYSTARQTQNVAEIGLANLSMAYAGVFNQEIVDLVREGAALVRIEEPQILDHPEDGELFKDAMGCLAEGVDLSRLALATWFGDIKDPNFFQLPFGIFALDFVRGRETVSILSNFPSDKKLVAGIVDARHPYQESDKDLAELVGSITEHVSPSQVLFSPNTDLHFLPWSDAIGKVRRLTEFATRYRLGTLGFDTLESAPRRVISELTH